MLAVTWDFISLRIKLMQEGMPQMQREKSEAVI